MYFTLYIITFVSEWKYLHLNELLYLVTCIN